jgi:threonine dehydratase
MRAVRTPDVDDVRSAREIVAGHLTPTPVIAAPSIGAGVVLKLETVLPTGSFKVRGGLVAVGRALADGSSPSIIAASAGNHGLGVAYAASVHGAHATIVIPENASPVKRAALERFAIELVTIGTSYDDAERHALELAAHGGRFVSPYNDPDTIAGQGTLGLELFDQLPEVRTIVVPIGGGGLVSGIGLAASPHRGVRIIGVEAAASPAMKAALDGDELTVLPTLADGLAGHLEPGSITVDLARQYVDEIVTVTEREIALAVVELARDHGLLVEGSGAVGVAALRAAKIVPDGPTAVVLTGRNIAPSALADLLTSTGP